MATLSNRGREYIKPPPEYVLRSFDGWRNQYHPETNPDGCINLSIAENLLSLECVAQKLSSAPPVPISNLTYGNPDHFNAIIAKFLAKHVVSSPVAPNHVVVLNGATAILDSLATVLCDPGDKVLVTGPGYKGLELDVSGRAGTEVVIASLDDAADGGHPVTLVSALEKAWVDSGSSESGIKMAIICSPNNPTGEVLAEDTILDIVNWGRSKGIHLIFDEVYAQSVHSENAQFCSVAKALNGTRIGVLYSPNEELLASINSFLAHFLSTSRHTQWALEHVLSDDAWLMEYFESNRKRLRAAYVHFTGILDDLGVPYMPADAGFFVWVDLRPWMPECSREQEIELWKELCGCNVLLTPAGQCFGNRYGFFRVCFSAVDIATCALAWKRISENVLETREQFKSQ